MPRLTQLRTMLTSPDLDQTVAFYAHLGFECTGTWVPPDHDDGKPVWCEVARDDVALMFTKGDPEPHDHGDGVMHADVPEMSGSIYLNVDDPDAYFAEIKDVIGEFEFEPQDFPHGMREFAVRDNNGYLLFFGAPSA